MEVIKIKLNGDNPEHRVFVQKGNVDPITQKTFEYGDRIIIRAINKEVWLYDSWIAYGDLDEKTLVQLPKKKAIRLGDEEDSIPKHFSVKKRATAEPQIEMHTLNNEPIQNKEKHFQIKQKKSAGNSLMPSSPLDTKPKLNKPRWKSWWKTLLEQLKSWFK